MTKRQKRIVALGGIFLILILLFYSYHWIQFNNKVKIYNEKIHVEMSEIEVWALLGRPSPSYSFWNKSNKILIEGKEQEINVNRLVYKGTFFLREDIILLFDSKKGKLIHKERAIITFPKNYINYLP